MKRILITILLLSITASGQNSLAPQKLAPQGPAGTVTLTLAEFNRLVEIAARKPKPPENAPQPFVLSRAVFKLRAGNDSAVGTLDIDGEVLQKGPAKVPLVSGLTILEAQQSQKPLPLMREGAAHVAVISGPGPFSVSLRVAAVLTIDAGRASIGLPVPAAGGALLSLEIPGNHADARIEPGLITRRSTDAGITQIDATLEPGKVSRIWWTTREVTAPVTQREVRFLSDIKSLVTVGESESKVTALCDITVVQGEPAELKVVLPAGFEVTEATGSTLDSSEIKPGELVLKLREPSKRTHQFLIALERKSQEKKLDAPFFGFAGAQRETGEVLIEGAGTLELTAKEGPGVKRIDVREAGAIARSLSRYPLQAAFRFHRRAGEEPKLALEWNQFEDSSVLSAIAERATVTSLLNIEGKMLTEVTLRVRNHAQSFLKVELPQGATLLSAEVEGEKVKPVLGSDGSRVPMLRAGFRPSGAYTVSFVYLSSGAPFAKSGSYEMSLPKLDVPVSLVTWELFLPDRFEVKQFGGNALSASLLPSRAQDVLMSGLEETSGERDDSALWAPSAMDLSSLRAGQMGGIVVDPNGAIVPGATISVVNTQTGTTETATTDAEGYWLISGVRPGPVRVRIAAMGFKSNEQTLEVDSSHPSRLGTTLEVASVTETVTVTNSGRGELERESRRIEDQVRKQNELKLNAPSQNVSNLQRRVSGVLPVRIEVPRAGKSYRFVRPLVLEEETRISFQYKSK